MLQVFTGRKRGFTLIELLIVVAIIAILAAIAVPNFLEAQVRSKVSRVKSDMRSIDTALQAYYVDNNRYPPAYENRTFP
jgi:type II secretion system protein G